MPTKTGLITNFEADPFYPEVLKLLCQANIPFMLGGTFAVNAYTGINRPTKDLDIFCKTGDYPKILRYFKALGYKTEVEDERWIAKVKKGRFYFDVIFGSANAVAPVTDAWFKESSLAIVLNVKVRLIPPTELVWSKVFVQDRYKYDGSDISHLFLTKHREIKWRRLLSYMEQYWEVLLMHILNFRFIYPSEREHVPRWLLDELLDRLRSQISVPNPHLKVCRGRLFSRSDYSIDVNQWGFADLIGEANEPPRNKRP